MGSGELHLVVVRDQAGGDGDGAAGGDLGGEGVGVDVSNLGRARNQLRRDQLITGGDDGDAGASGHGELSDAESEEPANVLGPEDVPFRQDQVSLAGVLAHLDDIFAGGGGAKHLDGGVPGALGEFDHDHGVGAGSQGAAGVGGGGLARGQGDAGVTARGHVTNELQVSGEGFAGAEGVLGANGVTVHGGAREGGEVLRGVDGLGGYSKIGLRGGNQLHGWKGRQPVKEEVEGLLRGQNVKKLGHGGNQRTG